MQISKKLYTTLIIAVLTISTLLADIPMASAEILSPPFAVTKGGTTAVTGGPVGTQVDVVGNATSGAASPFSTVSVYWDALSGAVLGTSSADVNGAYNILRKEVLNLFKNKNEIEDVVVHPMKISFS